MKYTEEELKTMILPMIQSLGGRPPEELTDAIVEIIKQDREVRDPHLLSILQKVYSDGSAVFTFKDKTYRITEVEGAAND